LIESNIALAVYEF